MDDGKAPRLRDAHGSSEQNGAAVPSVRVPPGQPAAGGMRASLLPEMRERTLQVRGKKDLRWGGLISTWQGGAFPVQTLDYKSHHAQPELERVRHAGTENARVVLEPSGAIGSWAEGGGLLCVSGFAGWVVFLRTSADWRGRGVCQISHFQ